MSELLADTRVFFDYEPPDLDPAWADMMKHSAVGPSSWTDAYLAAFARQCGYEMATFHRDFLRWSGLKVTLLTPLPTTP